MIVVTERDKRVLEFIARWRFATLEQMFKAGIFNSAYHTCYKRLLSLRNAKLINSDLLPCGKAYYYLAPRGGEVISLSFPWYAKVYRNASVDTVLHHLIHCDFSMAMGGIDYITKEEALSYLIDADFDTLEGIFRANDRYFIKDGILQALVVDYGLSMKYIVYRVKSYSRLPAQLHQKVLLLMLVFSESKREYAMKAAADSGVMVKVLKGNWKY